MFSIINVYQYTHLTSYNIPDIWESTRVNNRRKKPLLISSYITEILIVKIWKIKKKKKATGVAKKSILYLFLHSRNINRKNQKY